MTVHVKTSARLNQPCTEGLVDAGLQMVTLQGNHVGTQDEDMKHQFNILKGIGYGVAALKPNYERICMVI